ncbi:MAG: bifunctional aldolase/short-chain dehydrogenase [Polyangiaceae bacterium]|jgi:rhamnose utilization protein RhaD (predicted bifunctional aldolase and dehydrogenase)/NAD(P)-dependent dehydrogenase (short-subunit alcohol dehydrogenase family)
MQSRYDTAVADRWVEARPPRVSERLALRTYSARLIGSEPSLVLHGGGNTSVKTIATNLFGDSIEVLHVKGSGWDLATIEPQGHPAVRLAPLRELRRLDAMSDEVMVNELRSNLLDAAAPTPSVETLLHAFLPGRFIDHTHADAILALANQPDGKRICTGLFGPGLVWVAYVMPGFELARRCIAEYERVAVAGMPVLMILEKHGLFTWGDTARESYERTIDAVSRAEHYTSERRRGSAAFVPGQRLNDSAVMPRLRGAFAKLVGDAPERGPIVRTRSTDAMLAFLARPDAAELVGKGCMTPDHVLRTKPTALLVQRPDYGDGVAFAAQLEAAVLAYAQSYDSYFEEMCRAKGVNKKKLDPWPRVVLLPGLGACGVAGSARDADVALDIYEHTAAVMQAAADVGAYEPCSRSDLFDVEYWSLEQAKLRPSTLLPMSGSIAAVTGAASGIGRASVARLLAAGAHVAMVDRDSESLEAAAQLLRAGRADRVLAIAADVRDTGAIEEAFAGISRAWGGIDIVVSNAGTAPLGRLETRAGEAALRDSLELNCLSHASVARVAVEIFTMQGRGGCLLFNVSKSAFNPGPGFGPYAVAKTALLALMRQYAVDLGARGIRSNAVNADRIRTGLFAGGVLEARAQARGLTVDDYFRANLLSREVPVEDVADAFVYLATARSTTGCVLTVDGGNAAAFPR